MPSDGFPNEEAKSSFSSRNPSLKGEQLGSAMGPVLPILGKGKFLKAAELACAHKVRYESAYEAERSSQWLFRAYSCPVCHHYHLTSRPGRRAVRSDDSESSSVVDTSKDQTHSGPTLGDLDWQEVLDPKPKREQRPPNSSVADNSRVQKGTLARCTSMPGKDHRVHLVVDGKLVKSAPVRDALLRAKLAPDVWVFTTKERHPVILKLGS